MAVVTATLLLLAIIPVYGAPSLSVGTTANYDLSASVSVTQSCTTDPVSLAYQACTGNVPPSNPPIMGQPFLNDDFGYVNTTQMAAAGWSLVSNVPSSWFGFGNSQVTFQNDGTSGAGASWTKIPSNLANWSVSARAAWVGNTVGNIQINVITKSYFYGWQADGYFYRYGLGRDPLGTDCCNSAAIAAGYTPQRNVFHTLRLDMLNNVMSGYFDGQLIVTYNEPNATLGGTDLTWIGIQGSWNSYDSYDWITAAPLSPGPPAAVPPPPAPTTARVNLSGNLGWNVQGLSTSRANLQVSHNIAVSVPVGILNVTPVTESGSFPQPIDLVTRQESPGTTTALLRAIMSASIPVTSGVGGQSSPSPALSSMFANPNGPDYTQWWVNGPLSIGSPVQILQGWSSVTGSGGVNLGNSIGSRDTWTVTSEVTQNINTNIPNTSNPLGAPDVSTASLDLSLVWSFDKTADLLLRNNDTISLTMHSETSIGFNPPPCTGPICTIGPVPPCTGSNCILTTPVKVIRDTSVKANLTLLLSSTSLQLKPQPTGPISQARTLMNTLASLPWTTMGVAGLVAGAIAGAAVLVTRKKGKVPPQIPGAPPGPSVNP